MAPRAFDRMIDSVNRTAPELRTAQRAGVSKAALFTKTTINTEIRSATGGDMRLSGRPRGTIGAFYRIRGGGSTIRAEVKARGPIALIELPIPAHTIPKQLKRKGRKRGVLKFNGVFRRTVVHPGVRRSDGPFRRGARKAAPKTPGIFQAEIDKGLRRAWL